MKKNAKNQLWYNPVGKEKDRRSAILKSSGLIDLAAGQEGRALLESYCRLYRTKL